jgi:uncharacterized protein (DUF362 family)
VPARSTVFRARSGASINEYEVNGPVVKRMVDDLVMAVTGQPTVGFAWATLVQATDVVGIKVSASGAPLFSTRPAVVDAIVEGLREAGVPPRNIIVWDRARDDLRAAGFFSQAGGYQVAWSEKNYDPQAKLTAATIGKLIFGDLLFVGRKAPDLRSELEAAPADKKKLSGEVNLSNLSHVSRVLTERVTKVINVPVLADNIFCGLSGALYNMSVQNVDNWRRLIQEPAQGDPAIPEMYADPRVGGKVVLHLMDGLVAVYAGAPFGDTNYAVQYGTLYASKDPVALDTIAVKQIEQWRLAGKLESAVKQAKYLETAATYALGNHDSAKIDVLDVR